MSHEPQRIFQQGRLLEVETEDGSRPEESSQGSSEAMEEKRLRKNARMREWSKKRYAKKRLDPEWMAKISASQAARQKLLRQTNPEAKERMAASCRASAAKRRGSDKAREKLRNQKNSKRLTLKRATDPVWREERNRITRERLARKYREDPDYRLLLILRGRVRTAIGRDYGEKAARSMELVGCSMLELKSHIESLFLPGMTWENRGRLGWHIDHKIPCASFNLSNPEDQKKCFHFTNLQPMWWRDNLSKAAKIQC